jgi:hypothetical protein
MIYRAYRAYRAAFHPGFSWLELIYRAYRAPFHPGKLDGRISILSNEPQQTLRAS